MGRFFVTAKPTFVDNKMFKIPVELMKSVLATKELQTDNLFKQTQLYENATDSIKHLNNEYDNKYAADLQNEYRELIDKTNEEILKNPLEYQKQMFKLKEIQRKILKDRTNGKWAAIEGRYNAYQQDLKDNAKLKDKDPETYNAVLGHRMNNLLDKLQNDENATYTNGHIYGKPDLMSEKNQKLFDKIKADIYDDFMRDENGKIIMQGGHPVYKTTNERVSEEEIMRMAIGRLMSDPEYKGYLRQMSEIPGFESYGESLFIKGEDGKQKLNSKNPFVFNQIVPLMEAYGYKKSTFKELQGALNAQKFGYDKALEGIKFKHRLALQQDKAKKDYQLAKAKGDIKEVGKNLIITKSTALATPEELQQTTDRFSYLLNRKSEKVITDKELKEYNKLKNSIEPFIVQYGNDILKTAGYDPENIKIYKTDKNGKKVLDAHATREAVMNHVLKIYDEIWKVKQDDNYGRKFLGSYTYRGPDGISEKAEYDDSKRKRILATENKLEKTFGDIDKFYTKNIAIKEKLLDVDVKTDVGKDLVDRLEAEMPRSVTKDPNLTAYDMNGVERGESDIKADTGILSIKGEDPLPYIFDKVKREHPEIKSLSQAVEEGYFHIQAKALGNHSIEYTIIPTSKTNDENFIGVSDYELEHNSGDNVDSFKVTLNDVDVNPFTNSNDPIIRDMALSFDSPMYEKIRQKTSYINNSKFANNKTIQEYGIAVPSPISNENVTVYATPITQNGFDVHVTNNKTGEVVTLHKSYKSLEDIVIKQNIPFNSAQAILIGKLNNIVNYKPIEDKKTGKKIVNKKLEELKNLIENANTQKK